MAVEHPTDILRPGDRAILTRIIPAGADGPGSKPWRLRFVATIRRIARLDDADGFGPRWGADLEIPEHVEHSGWWAIGRLSSGVDTTLVPAGDEAGVGARSVTVDSREVTP